LYDKNMSNRGLGGLGEAMLEAGKSFAKQSVQGAKQQVTGSTSIPSAPKGAPGAEQLGGNVAGGTPQDQADQDFVKDLYSSNQQQTANNPQVNAQMQAMSDEQKLAEARKRLMEQHMTTYYKPTFENRKQEESVADRIAREDQEKQSKKMEELQEEQKKNDSPMSVRMGAQRAEKFPGASG
jgi:hypothetical protein